MRGYFGLAFFEPKFEENIGTAIRSAHCFDASFIAIIGARYHRQPTDTMATERHMPIFQYKDLDDFLLHVPVGCEVVGVEVNGEDIRPYKHPESAIYLIGGEDRTLPDGVTQKRIKIPTNYCLNMAVAASIILYDRISKTV